MEPDRLIERIYDAAVDPACWPEVLAGLADHVGAQGGMLARVGQSRAGSAFVHTRLSDVHFELFETRHLWNPWTRSMRLAPQDRAIVMGSLVDRGELGRTAFHADVLAPQRTFDQINVGLSSLSVEGGVGGIGLPFKVGFDDLDGAVSKVDRLVPHLRRALEFSIRLGRLDRERELDIALGMLASPAFAIDQRGSVVLANAAAERLLRVGDGIAVTLDGDLQLDTALPAETAALRRALARAIAVSAGANYALDEALRLSRPSGKPPLLVFPTPLPARPFSFWRVSGARVIVLVVDPVGDIAIDPATLRSVFALTAAESRVALLVGSGIAVPVAAARLGIATTTVKTHLNRVFDKMDVRTQAQLARLLASLPSRPRPI